MKAKKSTKKNLFSLIYLTFFTIVLVMYAILLSTASTAKIEITVRSKSCQMLEVFTNTKPEVPLDIGNYHRISVNTEDVFSTYTIVVPLPLRYLRIDPCEKKQVSEISSIVIRNEKAYTSISLDPETYTCHNCTLSAGKDLLQVTALSNDPIMIVNTLEHQISSINARTFVLFSMTHDIAPLIVLLLCCSIFLFILKKSIFIRSIPGLLVIIIGIVLAKTLNIHAYLKAFFLELRSMFPPPPINREHIVGFAQYQGYPLYFEVYLFILFLCLPLTLSLLIFIFFRSRKKHEHS